jgi:D-threo-aldose 1-dehydrogenase
MRRRDSVEPWDSSTVIKAIADRHGVGMKAAGLHFALANPAVVAVIPRASQLKRIAVDRAAFTEQVPAAFWQELRAAGLMHADAPLPA